jgi:hypothetical protein
MFWFAASISGSTVKGYRDGDLWTADFNSGSFTNINDTSGRFTIGAMYSNSAVVRPVNGYGVNFCVWYAALSDAEIATISASNGGFDCRVNSGSYVSAASLQHMWVYGTSGVDLTTTDGVVDLMGNKNLTGVNFSAAELKKLFAADVP